MKLKQLVALLQEVSTFEEPDYQLEQYKTSADIAAHVIFTIANAYGDIGEGKLVADFGCGTGILGIGAALMGADVTGFDIDPKALAAAQQNAEELEVNIEFLQGDLIQALTSGASFLQSQQYERTKGATVAAASAAGTAAARAEGKKAEAEDAAGAAASEVEKELVTAVAAASLAEEDAAGKSTSPLMSAASLRNGPFDTVITNPPFGTRKAGADVAFVRAALDAVGQEGRVYSFHKSTTRAHMIKLAERLGLGCELVAELRFEIPAVYAFHRRDSVDVAVDLLRFVKGKDSAAVAAKHDGITLQLKTGIQPVSGQRGEAGAAAMAAGSVGGSKKGARTAAGAGGSSGSGGMRIVGQGKKGRKP